jgi:protein associated with RNAse G/E
MIVTSTNSVWQILSLKYNQKHHYTWPATLSDDDGERLRFTTVIGGRLVHYTRGFEQIQTLRSDLTFWRERWYNVFTNYDADGNLHDLYCNVAMPIMISNNTLQYVDLDLDVRFSPDGTFEILDEDEFEQHTTEFGYPAQVRNQALRTVDDIFAVAKSRVEPFNLLKM